jgi:hypothetical protein
MSFLNNKNTAVLRRVAIAAGMLAASSMMTGCISMKQYVDPTLPKVAVGDLKPADVKQSVQLFFEFQSNGVSNAKATEAVKPMLINDLKQSNLFTDVVVAPATADRKLFVTINNFPVTKDAASKGFMTGLTFGLAGTMVTDGYKMDAAYDAPGQAEVKYIYQHALHSTVGNADGPAGLTPAPKGQAVPTIVNDLVLNLLNDLSKNGQLK